MSIDKETVNAVGFAAAVLHGGPKLPTLEQWREMTPRDRLAAVDNRCTWVYQEGEAKKLDAGVVAALSSHESCVAAMLVAGGCIDAGEAAEAFASIDPLLDQDETGLVSRARWLAREWYAGGVQDTVAEPFRFAAWALGEGGSKKPSSGFPFAAERDGKRCPLRAGEIAAKLASAVAAFLFETQTDQTRTV
jgi:hypothetical protein